MADNTNTSYVFISYAHADSSAVLPAIQAMQSNNISLWYDNGIEAGSEWPEFIAEKVMHCRKFVLFVSKAYLASQNCKRELNFAISRKKDILSVFLEDVELSPGMEMQLGTYQAIFRSRFSDNNAFGTSLAHEHFFDDCRDANVPAPASESAAPTEDAPAKKPADHSSDLLASLTGLIANQTSSKPKEEPAAPAPAPKAEPKPEPKPQPKPEPKPQPKPEPKPQPKPEPKSEPKGPSAADIAALNALLAGKQPEKKEGSAPKSEPKSQPTKSYGSTPKAPQTPPQPPKHQQAANLPVKNKYIAALLAFFLGSFGAHKFYLGQKGWGFLYLIFFWTYIPGFISFFESIGLLMQSDAAFMEKYNCRIK